jgi:hypothetical protein
VANCCQRITLEKAAMVMLTSFGSKKDDYIFNKVKTSMESYFSSDTYKNHCLDTDKLHKDILDILCIDGNQFNNDTAVVGNDTKQDYYIFPSSSSNYKCDDFNVNGLRLTVEKGKKAAVAVVYFTFNDEGLWKRFMYFIVNNITDREMLSYYSDDLKLQEVKNNVSLL